MMSRLLLAISLSLAIIPARASTPTPQDFAYRQAIDFDAQHPLYELAVPDTVYTHILNDDLSDLRVFNQAGGVVPHAICRAAAPSVAEPILKTFRPFVLQAGSVVGTGDSGQIVLKTADGTQLTVNGAGASTTTASGPSAYVIDLRALKLPVQALRLNWNSADEASEATVSLKASEDLSRWDTLMPSATLLKAQADDAQLQFSRIPLPTGNYPFLRIEAGARGPLPRIESVVAEMPVAPEFSPLTWVEAQRQPTDTGEKAVAFWFVSNRHAPMHSAEVRLPALNMALVVTLQSRDNTEQGWRTRWSGEVFALSSNSNQRNQTVIQFEPTTDRLWRLEILRGGETLGDMSPSLVLGYRPARLRFLAQGPAPFTLAYGSARVERLAPSCVNLLGKLPASEREDLTGQAEVFATPNVGNLNVLKPLPKPTPLRQMLLWGVLIAGALLVAVLALSLLRRLRQE